MRNSLLVLLLGLLASCGESGPIEPSALPVLARFAGNGQEGKAGVELEAPLEVSVTLPDGSGAQNVTIDWSVTSGRGLFFSWESWDPEPVWSVSTRTDAAGRSLAIFVPTSLHPTTVTARGSTPGGVDLGFVDFVVDADTLVIAVGDGVDWMLSWPYGPQNVEVPVGTPVEWSSVGPSSILSTVAPPGGASFDSGSMDDGGHYLFVPTVPGTWEYEEEVTGQTATLVAR